MLLQRLRKAQAAKDANRAEQICKLRQDGAASQGTSTCAHCGLHLRHKTSPLPNVRPRLSFYMMVGPLVFCRCIYEHTFAKGRQSSELNAVRPFQEQ
ncbi:unnamed protein product [Symbiodinium necroappetens]|uniref:Uncharacterized protein n=1 Tax=Symbiodinium necroappetens TaxID=1628268 RepID=A0A812YM08_9DINO|nr:unnamed protein product [Symbiodinium necroappetens]